MLTFYLVRMQALPSTKPDQTILSFQIRGARRMLGWSMINLAKVAGLSVATVKRGEDAATFTPSSKGNLQGV